MRSTTRRSSLSCFSSSRKSLSERIFAHLASIAKFPERSLQARSLRAKSADEIFVDLFAIVLSCSVDLRATRRRGCKTSAARLAERVRYNLLSYVETFQITSRKEASRRPGRRGLRTAANYHQQPDHVFVIIRQMPLSCAETAWRKSAGTREKIIGHLTWRSLRTPFSRRPVFH